MLIRHVRFSAGTGPHDAIRRGHHGRSFLDHLLAGTVRILTAHSRQWAPMLRRSLELVLVVCAARRERVLGAAKGLVDILLEIILKEGEGPDKPGEVLL